MGKRSVQAMLVRLRSRDSLDVVTENRTDRRIILLVGSARSGTTWLASILDTYKGVIYCHEPLRELRGERLGSLAWGLKNDTLNSSDGKMLIRELCKGNLHWRRPPFFPKNDLHWPARFQSICWHLARITHLGGGLYCGLFSPSPNGSYDLLIKEVDWARHLKSTVRSLSPDVILIVRHPCAVCRSLLRGQLLGLMPREERRSWLHVHEEDCRAHGYPSSAVLAMDDYEFLALNWLLQNLTYQRVLENNPRAVVVVYEELCQNPLKIAGSLFQFLDWPMEAETQRFIELSTGRRHSFLSAIRRARSRYFGVFADQAQALDSWKTRLSRRAQKRIISIACQLPGYRDYWPE
jgi:Sulfotransferase domain